MIVTEGLVDTTGRRISDQRLARERVLVGAPEVWSGEAEVSIADVLGTHSRRLLRGGRVGCVGRCVNDAGEVRNEDRLQLVAT